MIIHIPSCVKLEKNQIKKAQQWFDERNQYIKESASARASADAWVEEDCDGGSSILFTVQNGGICCEIKIKCLITGMMCDLTIDDDNNLAPL